MQVFGGTRGQMEHKKMLKVAGVIYAPRYK